MIIGVMIDLAAGILCIVLGLLIWKKQKISFLHSYHYKNVREEDIPAYTRAMGSGLVLIGIGICLAGLLDLFESAFWWVPLSAGMAAGLMILGRGQKKYNDSWFG